MTNGDIDAPIECLMFALKIYTQVGSIDDLEAATALAKLGFLEVLSRNFKNALASFQESLTLRLFVIGEKFKRVQDTLSVLEIKKDTSNELHNLLYIIKECFQDQDISHENFIDVSTILFRVGSICLELRDEINALMCYRAVIFCEKRLVSIRIEEKIHCLYFLAKWECTKGNLPKAIQFLQVALKLYNVEEGVEGDFGDCSREKLVDITKFFMALGDTFVQNGEVEHGLVTYSQASNLGLMDFEENDKRCKEATFPCAPAA